MAGAIWLLLVFTPFLGGVAWLGFAKAWSAWRLENGGRAAEAEVVSVTTRKDGAGDVRHHPVVVFTAEDGRRVEREAPHGTHHPRFARGDFTVVVHDPRRPDRFRLEGDPDPAGAGWSLLSLLCLATVVFLWTELL
ncbi:DUF3592 domain-containing protein [Streptomyces sp. NPDC086023]|uniref:DUF3592 domain-containing protein n=1 Tax=Streptomyces sp. NPDC086023 TaxID=3365746 RepID=UPI0037D11327